MITIRFTLLMQLYKNKGPEKRCMLKTKKDVSLDGWDVLLWLGQNNKTQAKLLSQRKLSSQFIRFNKEKGIKNVPILCSSVAITWTPSLLPIPSHPILPE